VSVMTNGESGLGRSKPRPNLRLQWQCAANHFSSTGTYVFGTLRRLRIRLERIHLRGLHFSNPRYKMGGFLLQLPSHQADNKTNPHTFIRKLLLRHSVVPLKREPHHFPNDHSRQTVILAVPSVRASKIFRSISLLTSQESAS